MCPVIFGAKAFCRKIQFYIDKNSIPWDSRCIRISQDLKNDLIWWSKTIMSAANGISFDLLLMSPKEAIYNAYSDASGNASLGAGGFSVETRQYYQVSWLDAFRLNEKIANKDIQYLELLGVVLNLMMCAPKWTNSTVRLYCDNLDVVYMLADKKASHERQDLNQLIRLACEIAMKFSFYFWIEHIAGKKNVEADNLSRFVKNPLSALERVLGSFVRVDLSSELQYCLNLLDK